MKKNTLIEIMLILNELKEKNNLKQKDKWEIEKCITELKSIISSDNSNKDSYNSYLKEVLPSIIGFFINYFKSS